MSFQWIFRIDFLFYGRVGSPGSPRDSQESCPTAQFKTFNSALLTILYAPTVTSMHDNWKNRFDYTELLQQSNVFAFKNAARRVITFLQTSKHLLISWLQSSSAVNLEPLKIKSVTVSIVFPSICHEVMGRNAMIFIFWMWNLNQIAGSQRGEFRPWQRSWRKGPNKTQRWVQASRKLLWAFSSIYLQNQSLPALLHYAFHLFFWHYRGAISDHLFLEKVNLELQLTVSCI